MKRLVASLDQKTMMIQPCEPWVTDKLCEGILQANRIGINGANAMPGLWGAIVGRLPRPNDVAHPANAPAAFVASTRDGKAVAVLYDEDADGVQHLYIMDRDIDDLADLAPAAFNRPTRGTA